MSSPWWLPASRMTTYRTVLVHPRILVQLKGLLAHHEDVRITSGHRTVDRNRRVGGASRSRHLLGLAVDLVGIPSTLDHLAARARAYGVTEIVRESDHLHVAWPRSWGV